MKSPSRYASAYTHRKASRDGHRGCKEGRLGPRPSSANIWLRRVRKARHTLDAHFLKYDRFQQQILPRNPTLASDALHFKLQCVVFIPIVVYLSPAPRGQRQCRTLRWTNPSISIDHRINNKNRADAETGNGAGNDGTGRAAERACAGKQCKTRSAMLPRNDMVRSAQRKS